jgi:hypothetical protein
MEAPSERHLEDFLWSHPEALGMVGIPQQYGEDSPIYSFLFRQFRVPSGIIDLVAKDWRLNIFEIKKGIVTAQSLTQLMRYMRDIHQIVDHMLLHLCSDCEDMKEYLELLFTGSGFNTSELVTGTLVGSDYEDDNLLIACEACGVDVITYSYNGGQYEFSDGHVKIIPTMDLYDQWLNIASGALGRIVREIIEDEAQTYAHQRDSMRFNAIREAERFLDSLEGK